MSNLKYKNAFEELAYYFYQTIEGDDVVAEAMELLKKFKLVDENDEWIYEEDEE